MIGKLFALTSESAAEKIKSQSGELLAKYRGQASAEFQNEYYGGVKAKTVAEGISFQSPVNDSAEKLIETLLAGIRSGMTYGSAKNIKELQNKAEFVEVTNTYHHESNTRPDDQ